MRSARGDNVLIRVSWLIPAAILFSCDAASAQQGCENLVNLKLPYTLITSATSVPEGAAPAPAAPGAPSAGPGAVPAHCEVLGVTRPSRDSNIRFALWLPAASAWNGHTGRKATAVGQVPSIPPPLQSPCAAATPSPARTMAMKVAAAQTGPSDIRRN